MTEPRIVVMGASAGAVEALSRILPSLPKEFPLPILVVVHLPPDRQSLLPSLFADKCHLHVKESEDKESARSGVIYFAPNNYHLLVDGTGTLSLSVEEPVQFSRPSIDVLFESAAEAFGPRALGIVLSGASEDGAQGLRAICDARGQGWVQTPESAQVSIMPAAAFMACPVAEKLTLEDIAERLRSFAN